MVAGQQEVATKKNYQPIRVDNWGIFLLSRLQNYFTKKELCDLTLRFPAQNAQIKVRPCISFSKIGRCRLLPLAARRLGKFRPSLRPQVHKLILNACTEYFARLETAGEGAGGEQGHLDMPANFTPEALAPIIR